MKAKSLVFACGMALVAAGPIGSAQADGFYVAIEGGVPMPRDVTSRRLVLFPTGATAQTTYFTEFDTAYHLGGAAGYGFKNGLRVEGEVAYLRAHVDRLLVKDAGPPTEFYMFGNVDSWSFMVNGYLDFQPYIDASGIWGRVNPFIGGGVGFSRTGLDKVGFEQGNQSTFSDHDNMASYQVIGGVGFDLVDGLELSFQGRYFGTSDPAYTDVTNGATTYVRSGTHGFILGTRLTLTFNEWRFP